MRGALALLVAASWIALVPGDANAQTNTFVRDAAGPEAGSLVTGPGGRTWSSVAPAVEAARGLGASIVDDPVSDGIGWGALVGAGTGLGVVALAYARCGQGCEAPAAAPTFLLGGGVGAGTGALIGWLVDRARTSRPPSSRAVSVAPMLAPRYKAVAVSVRF